MFKCRRQWQYESVFGTAEDTDILGKGTCMGFLNEKSQQSILYFMVDN